MAVFNEPAQWDHTLGNNADTSTLPDDAAATAGIASLQKLFQLINATPLEAGGIAPDREDVNALFKYLGDQIFYTQNGGVPSYNADYDYVAGRVVLYNGNLYKCIQANGASSTVVAPDSDTAYWQRLDNYVRSVNGVNADAQGNVSMPFAPDYTSAIGGITFPYTAPRNGIISLTVTSTGGNAYFNISVDGVNVVSYDTLNVFDTSTDSFIIPIKKGSVAKLVGMGGDITFTPIQFIPYGE